MDFRSLFFEAMAPKSSQTNPQRKGKLHGANQTPKSTTDLREECLASRKRCDLKTRKRCDFFSAAQRIASDFSAISSAIFRRFFCDFCGKTCDLALCDLKTQRFFCDCDFLGRSGKSVLDNQETWKAAEIHGS